jgi:glycosyltransferase involved in cell wall biosynthesis
MEDIVSSLVAFDISDTPAAGFADHAACSWSQDSLVSVVIPCYNGEAFLREAIESALEQSYQRVEVIVVDDGSTDRSSEIAQQFPVRYIRQPNRGLTASRNLGVCESRGSYIVFLDADDRLKPDAVETGLRVLAERPECAMAVGDHLFISEDGSHLANSRKEYLAASHYEALLRSNFIEMISSVLFRRQVLDEVGGFNTDLRVAEDYELYLRIAREYPICSHPAVVAEYRRHQENTSHNSELMLSMTVGVLRSQSRYIYGDVWRLFAFLEGLRTWRRQYGRQLASELARSFSTVQGHELRRKLLLLLNHYPQGLILFLLLRIIPDLTKRKAAVCHQARTEETSLLQRVHAWLNASKATSPAQIG